MEICFITPTPMLRKIAVLSETHLVLAHIYEQDEAYRNFYKEKAKEMNWVMLDNSAYELGAAVAVERLKVIAEDLYPDVIFLPDKRFDKDATLEMVRNAIPILKDTGAKLLAVPQGSNQEEILECYDALIEMEGIDGIGLYEEIGEVCCATDTREDFLVLLERTNRVVDSMYYHLLGMEEDVQKIRKLSSFKWVNSIDSVKPIVYGLNHIHLGINGNIIEYPHRPKDYFQRELDSRNEDFIKENCQKAKRWANGFVE